MTAAWISIAFTGWQMMTVSWRVTGQKTSASNPDEWGNPGHRPGVSFKVNALALFSTSGNTLHGLFEVLHAGRKGERR